MKAKNKISLVLFAMLSMSSTNAQSLKVKDVKQVKAPRASIERLKELSPAFAKLTDEVLFDDIWNRPGLSPRDKSLITISVLLAMGRGDQAASHIKLGLEHGLTEAELEAAMTQIAFYAGWPSAVTGLQKLKEAAAADYTANPLMLVYDGAVTKNERGKVNIHPVSYKLNGIKISANVYTPPNYDKKNKYPVIAVAHPNGGVKEQTAGLYAQQLAEQGYITIAADAAYQGSSGGEPRNTDKPANRIEDIHGMADFIIQYPGADSSRLGLLGICGGGGYSLAAAKTDKRFKAVATLSMFNSGRVRRNGFADSALDSIQDRLKQASDARAQEAAGGKILYSGDADLTDEQIAKLPFEMYRQGYHYYWRTNAHPKSTFKYTTSSLLDLMRWDATDQIDLIQQPLLMIAGSKADTLYMSEDAFKKAAGTKDKELYKIEGATHIETYWVSKYVKEAMDKLKPFFAKMK